MARDGAALGAPRPASARSSRPSRSACATRGRSSTRWPVPVRAIRLGGGGARRPVWRHVQADVYGREVEVLEAEEGAAYGAAILAGVGAGVWPSVDAACDAVVHISDRVEPDPETAEALDARYEAFRFAVRRAEGGHEQARRVSAKEQAGRVGRGAHGGLGVVLRHLRARASCSGWC